jgi:hypothetical protein
MLALQIALDRWIYGRWGSSIGPYLASNALPIVGRWFWDLGLRRIGAWLYTSAQELQGLAPSEIDYTLEGRQIQSRAYYFANLDRALLWPVVFLGAVGLLRAVRRPRWPSAVAAVTIFIGLLVMSSKGAKNLRLLVPLLPFVGLIAALGWAWLQGIGRATRLAAALFVASTLPLALHGLGRIDLARYSGYWQAMEFVNRDSRSAPEPLRVAAAFDWAIYARATPTTTHAPLPFLLDRWEQLDDDMRTEQRAALDRLDRLLVHLAAIEKSSRLMAEIQPRFEIRAAFFDPADHGPLGPVLLLGRIEGLGPRFFERLDSAPARGTEPLADVRVPLHFAGSSPDGAVERLTLVGADRRTIPGSGLEWIDYTWRAETEIHRVFRAISRITGPGDVHLWNDRHSLAYGVWPTDSWHAGDVVREGVLIVRRSLTSEQETLRDHAIAAGADAATADFWVALIESSVPDRAPARLKLVRADTLEPVRATLPPDSHTTEDGIRFTRDGLTFVGSIRP